MKRYSVYRSPSTVFGAALWMAVLFVASTAAADPVTVSVQGVLTTSSGGPVANGAYDLTIAVYDSPDFAAKTLYSMTQKGVTVTGGLFAVDVGSPSAPLDSAVFATPGPLYVGVAVSADPELPRVPIRPVPLAVRALSAATADIASSLACDGCVAASTLAPEVGVVTTVADEGTMKALTSPVGSVVFRKDDEHLYVRVTSGWSMIPSGMSVVPPCGNGQLDPGEDCDLGVKNGTAGASCSKDCVFIGDPCINFGGTNVTITPQHLRLCSAKVKAGGWKTSPIPGNWHVCTVADMLKWAPTSNLAAFVGGSSVKGAWIDGSCTCCYSSTPSTRIYVCDPSFCYSGSGKVALNDEASIGCQDPYYADQTWWLFLCHG